MVSVVFRQRHKDDDCTEASTFTWRDTVAIAAYVIRALMQ